MIEVAPGTIVAVVGHDGGPARIARRFYGVGYVPPGRRVFGSLTVEENLAVGAYRRPKDFAPSTPASRACRSAAPSAPGPSPGASNSCW